MPDPEFRIDISDQSVNVRLDVSTHSGRSRFYWLGFLVAMLAIGLCIFLFSPGKNGNPSMWHGMTTSSAGYLDFLVPFFTLIIVPPPMFFFLRGYLRFACPSDETLACDRSSLTVARVRWLDIRNRHWITSSYPLREVQEIGYRELSSFRGSSVYGLRFVVGNKTYRVLPGLLPRDAERILNALKALGVNVPVDPELARKLNEDISNG